MQTIITSKILINTLILVIPAWTINSFLNLLIPLQKVSPFAKWLSVPIDMRRMVGKNRLLGDSTTVLGLITALGLGLLIQLIFPIIPGLLIGFGMYLGHLCGSFIKRRLGVKGGEFLPILDHGDGILVTGGILYGFGYISLNIYILSFILTLIFYPIICYIAYKVNLREKRL